jgi:predicted amidophosphoribosyltransferase
MSHGLCPVCGHQLDFEPINSHEICPCCGVHFGYDDATRSHDRLREIWVKKGMKWWSQSRPAPDGWDPKSQLATLTILDRS